MNKNEYFSSNQKLPNSKNTFSLPTKYWSMSSIVDCYGCNDKIKDANEVKDTYTNYVI